jgi:hypothetical protein
MTYFQTRKPLGGHSHKYFVDSNTGDAICLCGRVQGSPKAKARENKYHAKTCFYNGYHYDSMLEANAAMELDWRLKAGDIKAWDKQFSIDIRNPKTDEFILRHKVDFRVHENDGSFTLQEMKGFEQRDYRILKKLIEVLWLPEHLDYKYLLVKEPFKYRVINV